MNDTPTDTAPLNEADPAPPRQRRNRRRDTRLALIIAAERIFSEEGISNVSLRRITQAAGARNESAIHYHFGSREGVVQAILDHRTTPVNADRVAMLQRLSAQGRPLGSREVAEALCRPLAHYLRDSGGRSHYLRFLGMLWLDRPMWRHFEGRTLDEGLLTSLGALSEINPHLPKSLVRHRYGLAIQMSTYSLARMERAAFDAGPRWDWARAEAQIESMIDGVTAVFDAPLSPNTVRALRNCGEL